MNLLAFASVQVLLLSVACTLESHAFVAPNSGRSAAAPFWRQKALLHKSSTSHDQSHVSKQYVDSCRNFLAAFLFGVAITISPIANPTSPMHAWFVANAEEPKVTLDASGETENRPESGGQLSLLTAPSATGSQDDHEESLVEQVWSLIDKYFIDQTFNGQVGIIHKGQHAVIPFCLY